MIEESEVFYTPKLKLPNGSNYITAGDIIILERFSTVRWIVGYGWYSFDGNRKINGWYLTNFDSGVIKPLQETDLYDIYFVETAGHDCNPTPIPPESPMEYFAVYSETDYSLNYYYRSNKPSKHDRYYGNHVDLVLDGKFDEIVLPDEIKTLVKSIIVVDEQSIIEFDFSEYFREYSNLRLIDLKNLKIKEILSVYGMFTGLKRLSSIILGDIDSEFITNTSYMFDGCVVLDSLDMKLNTINVVDFTCMFKDCEELPYSADYFEFGEDIIPLHDDFNLNAPYVIPPIWPKEENEEDSEETDKPENEDDSNIDLEL